MTITRALSRYARRGDPEAFAALVDAYGGMVFGVCRRLLPTAQDAEDATQECFLALARQAGRVRRNVPAWLHRCATNHCLDMRRSAASRAAREKTYAGEVAMRASEGAAAAATWQEIAPRIDDAIGHLPEELQTVLIEHYLRRRSQPEIARELGVSTATVSRRCQEAVKGVRAELERQGMPASAAGVMAALAAAKSYELPAKAAAGLGKLGVAGIGAGAAGVTTTTKVVVGVVAALAVAGGVGLGTGWTQNQWKARQTRALLDECSHAVDEYLAAQHVAFVPSGQPETSNTLLPYGRDAVGTPFNIDRWGDGVRATSGLLWAARDTPAGRRLWDHLRGDQQERMNGVSLTPWHQGVRSLPGAGVVAVIDGVLTAFICIKQLPEKPAAADGPPNATYWLRDEAPPGVPLVLDAWGNPVMLVAGGSLWLNPPLGHSSTVKPAGGLPFFVSAGPDGDQRTGGDNVYAY